MAYAYIIMPDAEEGFQLEGNIFFANNEKHLPQKIKDCSARSPHAPICVYKLDELSKVVSPPVLKRYKYLNGEIIPV